LIDAWFGESLHDSSAIPQQMNWWFSADPERDAELEDRFGD
jgi:hypothetical protein